ncbi:hypothetical protein JCM10295v2_002938 [Rhodotorula toruloides]
MAKDFAVYDFKGFNASLVARNYFRALYCTGDASSNPACIRSFSADGPFENLIELDDSVSGDTATAKRQGWRYGPFLTTRYGLAGLKDRVWVKVNETDNLSFDWRITWTAATALGLAVSSPFSVAFEAVDPDELNVHEEASSQDFVDVTPQWDTTSALGVVLSLESPIDAHYWLTRSLSTGISLPFELAYSALTASDLACDSVRNLISRASFFTSILFPAILFSSSPPSSSPSSTCCSAWNGSGADRGLAVAVAALLDYGPVLPHILTSSYTPTTDDAGYKLLPGDLLMHESIAYAIDVLTKVSQAHLNYRLHTFAGTHRLSAILVLVHSICNHGSTVLTSFFGSWEARPPFYAADLVSVLPEVALAWQAFRYPTVKQEEEEEE